MQMTNSLKKIISEEEISRRVDEIAAQIQKDYAGEEIVILCVLSGSVVFLADLIRRLDLPMRLDMVSISSYREKSVTPRDSRC